MLWKIWKIPLKNLENHFEKFGKKIEKAPKGQNTCLPEVLDKALALSQN